MGEREPNPAAWTAAEWAEYAAELQYGSEGDDFVLLGHLRDFLRKQAPAPSASPKPPRRYEPDGPF